MIKSDGIIYPMAEPRHAPKYNLSSLLSTVLDLMNDTVSWWKRTTLNGVRLFEKYAIGPLIQIL